MVLRNQQSTTENDTTVDTTEVDLTVAANQKDTTKDSQQKSMSVNAGVEGSQT